MSKKGISIFVGVFVSIALLTFLVTCTTLFFKNKNKEHEAYDKGYEDGVVDKNMLEEQIKNYQTKLNEANTSIVDLNAKITTLTKQNEKNQLEITTLTTEKTDLETQIRNLLSIKSSNEATINSLNNQINSLTSQVTTLKTSGDKKTQEINSLNTQISNLQTMVLQLQTTNATNSDTIKQLKNEVSELELEKNTLMLSGQQKDGEIENLTNRITSLNSVITQYESVNATNVQTINTLNAHIKELEDNIVVLKSNIATSETQITELNKQIASLQYSLSQSQTTNEINTQTIASLNAQIVNLNSQISELTNYNQNSVSQITSLNAQIAELQKSIAYYENYIAALENGDQVVATFEYDGSVYNIQLVDKGSKLSVITPESTTYKVFNGWKVNGEIIDLATYTINSNTKIVADITYKYDVIFKVDNAEISSQIITKGASATLPANPVKDGYVFDGWSIDGVTIIENIASTSVTQNTTYTAVFTKLHTVTFVYEDVAVSTQSIRNGEYASAVDVNNTVYKVFNGWKVNNAIVDITTYKITSDTIFVADIVYKYDVVFKVDTTNYNTQIVTKGASATLPANPVKEGYAFDGWSIDGVTIIENIASTSVTQNTTYTAVFTKLHTVTFMYEYVIKTTQLIRDGQYARSVDVVSDIHAVFNGWKVNDAIVDITTYKITSDTVFVADITYKYDVIFKIDNEVYDTQLIVKNENAVLPVEPTKSGFEFDGWSVDGETIIDNITSTAVTENTTYIAVFTQVFDVQFVVDEVVNSVQSVRLGAYAVAPDIASTDYFVFNGWLLDGVSVDITTYEINANVTFIADVTHKYDVNLMVDNSVYHSNIVAENEKTNISFGLLSVQEPKKDGYIFDGWELNGHVLTSSEVSNYIVTGHVSFNAVFVEKLTLTLKVDNEDYCLAYAKKGKNSLVSNLETNQYGFMSYNKISQLSVSKTGYELAGWSLNGSDIITEYTFTEDTTLFAVFNIVEYTLTFMANGQELEVTTYTVESDINTPTVPTYAGYRFVGWGVDNHIGEGYSSVFYDDIDKYKGAGNAIAYAVYSPLIAGTFYCADSIYGVEGGSSIVIEPYEYSGGSSKNGKLMFTDNNDIVGVNSFGELSATKYNYSYDNGPIHFSLVYNEADDTFTYSYNNANDTDIIYTYVFTRQSYPHFIYKGGTSGYINDYFYINIPE